MLPDTTIAKLQPIVEGAGVELVYYVNPLPKGLLTVAQGGLAVLFPATMARTQRYDSAQRLRFQLMGIMPIGHNETFSLNDSRLSLAALAVRQAVLVYCRDAQERLRYELTVSSRLLDFRMRQQQFFPGDGAIPGRQSA